MRELSFDHDIYFNSIESAVEGAQQCLLLAKMQIQTFFAVLAESTKHS